MRYIVGKSTLASITAKALGWEVLDTDAILETRYQMSISRFILTRGYDALRIAESEVLINVLRKNPSERVIACGSRTIELEENRVALRKFRERSLVIHVIRDKSAVTAYVQQRPAHHKNPDEWERLVTLFRECCSFEFASLTVKVPQDREDVSPEAGANELSVIFKPVENDFFRLLRFIHGVDTNKVPTHQKSYFLPLTYNDLNKAIPHLEELSIGLDLWGIRGDLLASYDPSYLSFQVATLRRHSTLPVIFTVRTKSTMGNYPDVEADNTALQESLASFCQHALRLGIEYVEFQFDYPRSVIESIVSMKGNASIIGTYIDTKDVCQWEGPESKQIYDKIVDMGADAAIMAFYAKSFEDNMSLQTFTSSVTSGPIPLVALNLGIEVSSRFSR